MDLYELIAELESRQVSASGPSFDQRSDRDSAEDDVHFPDEQDHYDPDFDGQGGSHEPPETYGVQYEDYDNSPQTDDLYTGVNMRLFEQGKVQLQYLSKNDRNEKNARRLFLDGWTTEPKPFVRDIFLVLRNSPDSQRHERDFVKFESKTRIKMRGKPRKQYITPAFHGTKHACTLGNDPGETNPCSYPECSVCHILKGTFIKPTKPDKFRRFGLGIYSSTNSNKADDYSDNIGIDTGNTTKVMFLCTVITGRKLPLKQSPTTKLKTRMDPDHESVVATTKGLNETIVYNQDQIKPHLLITYSLQQTVTTVRPSPPLQDHGVYTIANDQFHKALLLDPRTGAVVGDELRGGDNQLWIFEKDPQGGWLFRNKAQPDVYLSIQQSRNGDPIIVGVPYNARTVWNLRKSQGNTYRIAPAYDKQQNIALGQRTNIGTRAAVLGGRVPNAHDQMWFFDYVEPWNGPYGSANDYTPFLYRKSNTGEQVQSPIHNGVFLLVSERFGNVMDLAKRGGIVFGWKFLNGDNQKWIFEQSNRGWLIKNFNHQTQYLGVRANIDHWKEVVPVNQRWPGKVVEWDLKKETNMTVRIHPVGWENVELSLRGMSDQDHILLWNQGQDFQIWKLFYLGSLSS